MLAKASQEKYYPMASIPKNLSKAHRLLSVAFMAKAWEKARNDASQASKQAHSLLQEHRMVPFQWEVSYYDMPALKDVICNFGYEKSDFERWHSAIAAETMAEAVGHLSQCPKYPEFVLLMLFNHKCQSRHDAILAVQEYERLFPQADFNWQVPLAKAALICARDNVLELTVPVCRIYVEYAKRLKKGGRTDKWPLEENDLIYELAGFSPYQLRNSSDTKVLLEAQRVLFQGLKGSLNPISVFSISWLLLSSSPADALKTARLAAPGKILPSQHYLATFGPVYIELVLTSSFSEAYRVFSENNLGSASLPPQVLERNWGVFILALKQQGERGFLLANSVVDLMQAQNFKLTQYLTTNLLQLCPSRVERRQLIERIEPIVELDAQIKLGLGYVSSAEEFDEMLSEASSTGPLSYQSLKTLLEASVKHGNQHSFMLYQQIVTEHKNTPTSWMLQKLCQAAYKPFVRWGDRFAPQEATLECLKHLRGLDPQSDPGDISRIYPTPQTVNAYTVMLGKAQYLDKLREVLLWLERIKMPPQKDTLLALIYYLPEGKRLFDLGTRAGPEWPTRADYDMYILEHHLEPREY